MVPKLKEKIIIKWQTVFTFANTYIFFCNCTFCHNRRTHFRSRQITCDIAEIISCSLSHIFSVRYAAAIIQLLQFHSCESLFSFGWLPLFWACFIQEFVTIPQLLCLGVKWVSSTALFLRTWVQVMNVVGFIWN